jgi:hypothetical protein
MPSFRGNAAIFFRDADYFFVIDAAVGKCESKS